MTGGPNRRRHRRGLGLRHRPIGDPQLAGPADDEAPRAGRPGQIGGDRAPDQALRRGQDLEIDEPSKGAGAGSGLARHTNAEPVANQGIANLEGTGDTGNDQAAADKVDLELARAGLASFRRLHDLPRRWCRTHCQGRRRFAAKAPDPSTGRRRHAERLKPGRYVPDLDGRRRWSDDEPDHPGALEQGPGGVGRPPNDERAVGVGLDTADRLAPCPARRRPLLWRQPGSGTWHRRQGRMCRLGPSPAARA